MSYKTKFWTQKQLEQMNTTTFMIDFLDTFKISPLILQSDNTTEHTRTILVRVEQQLTR
jgi:hypothetical protein